MIIIRVIFIKKKKNSEISKIRRKMKDAVKGRFWSNIRLRRKTKHKINEFWDRGGVVHDFPRNV